MADKTFGQLAWERKERIEELEINILKIKEALGLLPNDSIERVLHQVEKIRSFYDDRATSWD